MSEFSSQKLLRHPVVLGVLAIVIFAVIPLLLVREIGDRSPGADIEGPAQKEWPERQVINEATTTLDELETRVDTAEAKLVAEGQPLEPVSSARRQVAEARALVAEAVDVPAADWPQREQAIRTAVDGATLATESLEEATAH